MATKVIVELAVSEIGVVADIVVADVADVVVVSDAVTGSVIKTVAVAGRVVVSVVVAGTAAALKLLGKGKGLRRRQWAYRLWIRC